VPPTRATLDLVMRRSLDGGQSLERYIHLVYEDGDDSEINHRESVPVVDRADGTVWLALSSRSKMERALCDT